MRLTAPKFWETNHFLAYVWLPFAILYAGIICLRQLAYRLGLLKSQSLRVPIILVGNIRIGGTGKTPIVIALAKSLYYLGFSPGVIARGYLSQSLHANQSLAVDSASRVADVGDEALLIYQRLSLLNIPVWVGKKRVQTAQQLLNSHPICNVIISDDGLQHYALSRNPARNGGNDIEIVVQDQRGIGNGFLLPAGPLRESASRSRDLTFELNFLSHDESPLNIADDLPEGTFEDNIDSSKVQKLSTHIGLAYPLSILESSDKQDSNAQSLPQLATKIQNIHPNGVALAMAGIADPEKFFNSIRREFTQLKTVALPDHYTFDENPFIKLDKNTHPLILITEKDAVKCQKWQDPRVWVVPIEVSIGKPLLKWLRFVLQRSSDNSTLSKIQ